MWWILYIAAIIVIITVIVVIYDNISVSLTHHNFVSSRIKSGFNGAKIVHLSDLQNTKYWRGYTKPLQMISAQKPDYIVFSGDLIDRRKFNLQNADEFVSGLVKIAPVYFTTGNHEEWCDKYPSVKKMLEKNGVTILENKSVTLEKYGEKINLIGLKDPGYISYGYLDNAQEAEYKSVLDSLVASNSLNILIAHRPEMIQLYADCKVDLAFCGHAHGGQFRLPIIGAFYAPHQGLFPKYTCGMHKYGGLCEVISRGLGNGRFQFRLFNRPEIIVVTLKNE